MRKARGSFGGSGIFFASVMISQIVQAKSPDFSKIWVSALSFLEQEERRTEYVALRSELLKDPVLTGATYRSLVENEVERKNRTELMALLYEVQSSVCSLHSSPTCKEFMNLWSKGLSRLLYYESSPQKIYKAHELSVSGNCREASSVLNEVERVEGRCIPLLEAWIEAKSCVKDEASIEALKAELDTLKGLVRAI
jgi:hypothetical protein